MCTANCFKVVAEEFPDTVGPISFFCPHYFLGRLNPQDFPEKNGPDNFLKDLVWGRSRGLLLHSHGNGTTTWDFLFGPGTQFKKARSPSELHNCKLSTKSCAASRPLGHDLEPLSVFVFLSPFLPLRTYVCSYACAIGRMGYGLKVSCISFVADLITYTQKWRMQQAACIRQIYSKTQIICSQIDSNQKPTQLNQMHNTRTKDFVFPAWGQEGQSQRGAHTHTHTHTSPRIFQRHTCPHEHSAVKHGTCVPYARWHGHRPTWPNQAPMCSKVALTSQNVCRAGGWQKKSSDAAACTVAEASLSIRHSHARVRVACSLDTTDPLSHTPGKSERIHASGLGTVRLRYYTERQPWHTKQSKDCRR